MKNTNGVYSKRGGGHRLLYYWRIDREKSKDFSDQFECAKDYVTHFIGRYPKYKELVYDKTWPQILEMFGIHMNGASTTK